HDHGMTPADLHELPDDVDALKAMIVAAQAKVASAEQRRQALEAEIAAHEAEIAQMKADKAADAEKIGRLESIIAMLQRAQYGTRSEKLRIDPLDDEQMAFAFDELRTGLGEIEASREKRS